MLRAYGMRAAVSTTCGSGDLVDQVLGIDDAARSMDSGLTILSWPTVSIAAAGADTTVAVSR